MNCRICLIEHDEATHAATLRVREWLRDKMRLVTDPPKPPKPKGKSDKLVGGGKSLKPPARGAKMVLEKDPAEG